MRGERDGGAGNLGVQALLLEQEGMLRSKKL